MVVCRRGILADKTPQKRQTWQVGVELVTRLLGSGNGSSLLRAAGGNGMMGWGCENNDDDVVGHGLWPYVFRCTVCIFPLINGAPACTFKRPSPLKFQNQKGLFKENPKNRRTREPWRLRTWKQDENLPKNDRRNPWKRPITFEKFGWCFGYNIW